MVDAGFSLPGGRFALFAFWALCGVAAGLDGLLGYDTIPGGWFWWPALALTAVLTGVAFLIRPTRVALVDLTGLAAGRRNWRSWAFLMVLTMLTFAGMGLARP